MSHPGEIGTRPRHARIPALALVAVLGLGACDEGPAAPASASDISGFSVRRGGTEIYAWDPSSFTQSDTFRIAAGDSVPVEFRWVNSSGEAVTVPASTADLTVTMAHPGIARWRADASNPFRGSFIGAALLQALPTAMQIELTIRNNTVLETSYLAVKVSP